MDGVAASSSSYKPPSGLRHAQSLDNLAWTTSPRKKYWGPLDKVRRFFSQNTMTESCSLIDRIQDINQVGPI